MSEVLKTIAIASFVSAVTARLVTDAIIYFMKRKYQSGKARWKW